MVTGALRNRRARSGAARFNAVAFRTLARFSGSDQTREMASGFSGHP
jgi:hypothetical protein